MPVFYPHQGRCHQRWGKTLGHLIATATAATLGPAVAPYVTRGGVEENKGCGHRSEWQPLWRSTCATALSALEGMGRERERERKGRDCRDLYAQWTEKEGASVALAWGVVVPSPLARPHRPWGAVVSSPPPRARERGWGGLAFFYEEWGER